MGKTAEVTTGCGHAYFARLDWGRRAQCHAIAPANANGGFLPRNRRGSRPRGVHEARTRPLRHQAPAEHAVLPVNSCQRVNFSLDVDKRRAGRLLFTCCEKFTGKFGGPARPGATAVHDPLRGPRVPACFRPGCRRAENPALQRPAAPPGRRGLAAFRSARRLAARRAYAAGAVRPGRPGRAACPRRSACPRVRVQRTGSAR